jgi:hypothetical protein
MKRRGIVYLRLPYFKLAIQYGSVSQIISPDPALGREAIKPFYSKNCNFFQFHTSKLPDLKKIQIILENLQSTAALICTVFVIVYCNHHSAGRVLLYFQVFQAVLRIHDILGWIRILLLPSLTFQMPAKD